MDMMNEPSTSQDGDFLSEIQNDLEQSGRALKEINLMLEQSQLELAKLTQRNAAITAHLQIVQAQYETLPRDEIRNSYNEAIDAQQRLLVMRGQMEKLQSDQHSLTRYIEFLEKVKGILPSGAGGTAQNLQVTGKGSILTLVIDAHENERRLLSDALHDGPAQVLSNFILQTEIAARMIDHDPAKAKSELESLKSEAAETFQRVRGFIFDLYPHSLDDLGLFPTLKRYTDNLKNETKLDIKLNVRGVERRLDRIIEVMVFRAVQELLQNIDKHTRDLGIPIQANVAIILEDQLIKVTVSDNGKGFDPANAETGEGQGLRTIRERVETIGGYMEIESGPGKGSRVTFQVPTTEVAIQPAF